MIGDTEVSSKNIDSESEREAGVSSAPLNSGISTVARVKLAIEKDNWENSIYSSYENYQKKMLELEKNIADSKIDDQESVKKYFNLRSRVMGVLPITSDMNFTSKNAIDKTTKKVLEIMFKVRLLLNLTQPILEDFNLKTAIENFKNQEKYLIEHILPKKFEDSIINGKELSKEHIQEVIQDKNKVVDSVYKVVSTDGLPVVVVTEVSEKTIQAAIKQLSHRPFITCYNFTEQFQVIAEREAILSGKPIYFSKDGNKTIGKFSRYMPKQPGNWLEFYQNIKDNKVIEGTRPRWTTSKDNPGVKMFIKNIIGDNLETLKSLWEQAVDINKQEEIKDLLSKEQKDLLIVSYESESKSISKVSEGSDQQSRRVRLNNLELHRSKIIENNLKSLKECQSKVNKMSHHSD